MDRVRDNNQVWFQVYLTPDAAISPVRTGWIDVDPELELLQSPNPDPQSLSIIHDNLYPVVYRYVRFRLEDEKVCEDITSEVFLRLLDTLNRRDNSIRNLRSWLLGTASHLVSDHLRLRYAHPEESLEDYHAGDFPGPEDAAEKTWQQNQVREALRKLTLEQQHVLALRFSEERSVEETARLMDKTVGAIKTLQFRALAGLRQLLGGDRNGKGSNRGL